MLKNGHDLSISFKLRGRFQYIFTEETAVHIRKICAAGA